MPARVVLVRQPPEAGCEMVLGQLPERLRAERGESLVFLHGDAVDHVVAPEPLHIPERISVAVCQTSWTRRHRQRAVPKPARASTLAGLLAAVERAPRLICLGCGGEVAGPPAPRPVEPLLIEIAFEAGEPRQRREALEVALAAAALDMDGRVLFSGPGYNHLLTEDARGWGQLTDFNLMELVWTAPRSLDASVPVRRINADRAARLRADAGRHLLL